MAKAAAKRRKAGGKFGGKRRGKKAVSKATVARPMSATELAAVAVNEMQEKVKQLEERLASANGTARAHQQVTQNLRQRIGEIGRALEQRHHETLQAADQCAHGAGLISARLVSLALKENANAFNTAAVMCNHYADPPRHYMVATSGPDADQKPKGIGC